jgi:hypothetical protein
MATQYSFGRIITDGLVLSLNAADKNSYPGSGTTWTDMSGNGNNGTLTNGPTFSSANGGSIVFDGVDDFVNVPNNSSLNSSIGTACIWFKYTSTTGPNPATLIGKHDTLGSAEGWNMFVFSDGSIGAQIKNNAGGATNSAVTSAYPANTWCNAILVFTSGASYSIYINGILIDSGSCISFGVSTQPLRLIDSVDTYWGAMAGSVALAQLYNRALTASEVLQNYTAQKSRFGL